MLIFSTLGFGLRISFARCMYLCSVENQESEMVFGSPLTFFRNLWHKQPTILQFPTNGLTTTILDIPIEVSIARLTYES